MTINLQVLTAALVVCRECLPMHDVEALSHVAERVDKYLDNFSSRWKLERACRAGLSRRALEYLAVHGCGWSSTSQSNSNYSIVPGLVRGGLLHVLEWIHEYYPERMVWKDWNRAYLLDAAALNGRLAIVKWLHANCSDDCTTRTMDLAASSGHLDVVQWLHQHLSEGCTSRAMDSAAGNGHLAVVRFLHENRSEGCSKFALDQASTNGHITAVSFLHENRQEGCTSEAMRQAAANGHLEVVQYLHTNRNEGHLSSALRLAARYNQQAVAEWLFGCVRQQRRGGTCIREAADIALEAGHFDLAKTLNEKLKRPRLE